MSEKKAQSAGGATRPNPRRSKSHAKQNHVKQSAAQKGGEAEEIRELRKKYVDKLVTLNELFPNWTDDDLLCTLEEAYGDLEITIDRISQGYVSQWGEVKGRKGNKRDRASQSPQAAAATAASGKRSDDRGAGGHNKSVAGKSQRNEKARARGGAGKGQPNGPRAREPQQTRVTHTKDSWAVSDAPLTADGWGSPTSPKVSDTPAKEPITKPASQAPEPSKMTWAKILGSKEPKKPSPEPPASVEPIPETAGQPSTAPSVSTLEASAAPPSGELSVSEQQPDSSLPEPQVEMNQENQQVASRKDTTGQPPVSQLEESPTTVEPFAEAKSAESQPPVSVESVLPEQETALHVTQPIPVPTPATKESVAQAIGTPPGFKRPSSQQRRLRQEAPVVMPFGSTNTADNLDVQFGSLGLAAGGGLNFGMNSNETRKEDHHQPTSTTSRGVPAGLLDPAIIGAQPAVNQLPSSGPVNVLSGFQNISSSGAGSASINKDYGRYGAEKPSQPTPSAPASNAASGSTNATPSVAVNPSGNVVSSNAYGPPGLAGNFSARDPAKSSGATPHSNDLSAHPGQPQGNVATHQGGSGVPTSVGAAGMPSTTLSNNFPPPGLQQPFQQAAAPYPGLPYYSYYYMPSGQFPNPAAGYQQSGYGQPFVNKAMYPMYSGSHPSAGGNKAAANAAGGAGASLNAASYGYGSGINPSSNVAAGAGLPFSNPANAPSLSANAPGSGYDDLNVGSFGNANAGGLPQLQNILGPNAGNKGVGAAGGPMNAGPGGLAGSSNVPGSHPGQSGGLKQGSALTNNPQGGAASGNVAGHNVGGSGHPQSQQPMQSMFSNANYPGMHPLSYQQQNYHPFSHQQPQQPPFIPGQQLYTAQHHYGGPQQPGYPPVPHHLPPSYSSHHGNFSQQQHQYHGQHAPGNNPANASSTGSSGNPTNSGNQGTGGNVNAGGPASQYHHPQHHHSHPANANIRGGAQNYWSAQN
ncbi:RNAPII degradation factor [Dispira simplex]|nr:RNAPII degradation factor [Dispira simplex]